MELASPRRQSLHEAMAAVKRRVAGEGILTVPEPPMTRPPRSQPLARREKCTILLDEDTSLRLSIAARMSGCDRSTYVNQLLFRALGEISLPAQLPKSAQITQSLES